MRAYAAIGIVLMHVLSNIGVKPSENYLTEKLIPWFTDFTLMFMVVSGFSLCCGYYDRVKTGAITPNAFYKKRYMRILPFFAFPEMRKSGFGALVAELILFGCWLVYALGSKDLILNNRAVRFISGLSMEVYLCHMVMFRVVERIHLERLIADGDMLYILTCGLVICGALAFSWLMKKYTIPRLIKAIN